MRRAFSKKKRMKEGKMALLFDQPPAFTFDAAFCGIGE
jgi:hypothetical protein